MLRTDPTDQSLFRFQAKASEGEGEGEVYEGVSTCYRELEIGKGKAKRRG